MRRIVLAAGGTVAGLAMLLTVKSHTGTMAASVAGAAGASGTAAAGAGAATGTGAAGGQAGAASQGGTTGTGAASGAAGSGRAGTAAGTPSAPPPAQGVTANTQEITGNVANTAYGPVQIQLAVTNRKITKVAILQQPAATAHDLQIGQFAFPQLEAETLSAQSAKINAVSGATYTSGGYIQSLQSAIDKGA